MKPTQAPASVPATKFLHPTIHKMLAGFALLLALGSWGFFFDPGGTAYVLAVVSGFLFVAVFIPFELWRVWRRDPTSFPARKRQSLHDWLSGRVEVQDHSMRARDAIIEALLPLGAAASGMVIFALIVHLVVPAGAL